MVAPSKKSPRTCLRTGRFISLAVFIRCFPSYVCTKAREFHKCRCEILKEYPQGINGGCIIQYNTECVENNKEPYYIYGLTF